MRRILAGLTAALAVAGTLALATPAGASFGFIKQWERGGDGIAASPSGDIYAAQATLVDRFTSSGEVVSSLYAGADSFNYLTGVAVDGQGRLYVLDGLGNSEIQRFDAEGNFQRKWGAVGDADGQLQGARDLAVDGASDVYVADSINNRIEEFTQNGTFVRVWGWGVQNG